MIIAGKLRIEPRPDYWKRKSTGIFCCLTNSNISGRPAVLKTVSLRFHLEDREAFIKYLCTSRGRMNDRKRLPKRRRKTLDNIHDSGAKLLGMVAKSHHRLKDRDGKFESDQSLEKVFQFGPPLRMRNQVCAVAELIHTSNQSPVRDPFYFRIGDLGNDGLQETAR